MATLLTQNNAHAAIGRFVKIREKSNNKSGGGGKLVAVEGDEGLVRVNGHGSMIVRYPLWQLADDTSKNGGALPVAPPPQLRPVRVPEPTIVERQDQTRQARTEELRSAIAEAELTDFGDFAAKVKAATADVMQANKLRSETRERHASEMAALSAKHKAESDDAARIVSDAEASLAALKSKATALLSMFNGSQS